MPNHYQYKHHQGHLSSVLNIYVDITQNQDSTPVYFRDLKTGTRFYKMVKEIANTEDYTAETGSGKVVVDFYANWCGPCVAIKDYYGQLANENGDIKFLKVNVDTGANKGAMQAANVRCMPTFVFYNNGAIVDRLEGANKSELAAKVAKLKSA